MASIASSDSDSRRCGLILAAGRGTRMKSAIPKVMHTVNHLPMLVHQILAFEKAGIKKIWVVVGENVSELERGLAAYGCREKVGFLVQPVPNGSGGAVQAGLQLFEEMKDQDQVLVTCGDMPLLNDQLLKSVLNEAPISMLVTRRDDPFGYGRVTPEGRIIEETDATEEEKEIQLINGGVYCFSAKTLRDYLPKLTCENKKGEYQLTDVMNMAADDELKIRQVELPSSDGWMLLGVNTQEQLAEAQDLYNRHYLGLGSVEEKSMIEALDPEDS